MCVLSQNYINNALTKLYYSYLKGKNSVYLGLISAPVPNVSKKGSFACMKNIV